MFMNNWFYNPEVQFHMWGITHLLTICVMIILFIGIYKYRKALTSHRRSIRLTVGWLLIGSRLSLDIWYVTTDRSEERRVGKECSTRLLSDDCRMMKLAWKRR